jgi:hypothetical protein
MVHRRWCAISDPVAGLRDRLDDGRLTEPSPQPADRDLDGRGERVGGLVPDAIQRGTAQLPPPSIEPVVTWDRRQVVGARL